MEPTEEAATADAEAEKAAAVAAAATEAAAAAAIEAAAATEAAAAIEKEKTAAAAEAATEGAATQIGEAIENYFSSKYFSTYFEGEGENKKSNLHSDHAPIIYKIDGLTIITWNIAGNKIDCVKPSDTRMFCYDKFNHADKIFGEDSKDKILPDQNLSPGQYEILYNANKEKPTQYEQRLHNIRDAIVGEITKNRENTIFLLQELPRNIDYIRELTTNSGSDIQFIQASENECGFMYHNNFVTSGAISIKDMFFATVSSTPFKDTENKPDDKFKNRLNCVIINKKLYISVHCFFYKGRGNYNWIEHMRTVINKILKAYSDKFDYAYIGGDFNTYKDVLKHYFKENHGFTIYTTKNDASFSAKDNLGHTEDHNIDLLIKYTKPVEIAICNKTVYKGVKPFFKYDLANDVKLILAVGSVLNFKGDAIVNAANEKCLGGGGIDGFIDNTGGDKLIEQRNKLQVVGINADGKEIRCPTGEAKITSNPDRTNFGELHVAHVIHAVGPQYPEDSLSTTTMDEYRRCDEKLKQAYISSIEVANNKNLQSIAFALISAGVYKGKATLEHVLSIARNTIREYVYPDKQKTKEIFLVAFKDEEKRAFDHLIRFPLYGKLYAFDFDQTILKIHAFSEYANRIKSGDDIVTYTMKEDALSTIKKEDFADFEFFNYVIKTVKEKGGKIAIVSFGIKELINAYITTFLKEYQNVIRVYTSEGISYTDKKKPLIEQACMDNVDGITMNKDNVFFADDDSTNIQHANDKNYATTFQCNKTTGFTEAAWNEWITNAENTKSIIISEILKNTTAEAAAKGAAAAGATTPPAAAARAAVVNFDGQQYLENEALLDYKRNDPTIITQIQELKKNLENIDLDILLLLTKDDDDSDKNFFNKFNEKRSDILEETYSVYSSQSFQSIIDIDEDSIGATFIKDVYSNNIQFGKYKLQNKDAGGSGDCLFRSLAYGLFNDNDYQESSLEENGNLVREYICNLDQETQRLEIEKYKIQRRINILQGIEIMPFEQWKNNFLTKDIYTRDLLTMCTSGTFGNTNTINHFQQKFNYDTSTRKLNTKIVIVYFENQFNGTLIHYRDPTQNSENYNAAIFLLNIGNGHWQILVPTLIDDDDSAPASDKPRTLASSPNKSSAPQVQQQANVPVIFTLLMRLSDENHDTSTFMTSKFFTELQNKEGFKELTVKKIADYKSDSDALGLIYGGAAGKRKYVSFDGKLPKNANLKRIRAFLEQYKDNHRDGIYFISILKDIKRKPLQLEDLKINADIESDYEELKASIAALDYKMRTEKITFNSDNFIEEYFKPDNESKLKKALIDALKKYKSAKEEDEGDELVENITSTAIKIFHHTTGLPLDKVRELFKNHSTYLANDSKLQKSKFKRRLTDYYDFNQKSNLKFDTGYENIYALIKIINPENPENPENDNSEEFINRLAIDIARKYNYDMKMTLEYLKSNKQPVPSSEGFFEIIAEYLKRRIIIYVDDTLTSIYPITEDTDDVLYLDYKNGLYYIGKEKNEDEDEDIQDAIKAIKEAQEYLHTIMTKSKVEVDDDDAEPE